MHGGRVDSAAAHAQSTPSFTIEVSRRAMRGTACIGTAIPAAIAHENRSFTVSDRLDDSHVIAAS
jgi:hypothetical protein